MSGLPIASRVTRGMAAVAALSALVLAGAAAITARILWKADQRQELRNGAEALATAIKREASEEGLSLENAGPEALRESAVPGARVEIWSGPRLVAANGSGPVIGREKSASAGIEDEWVIHRRKLPEGLVLVMAAPAEYERRALRVFAFSFVFASPICLAVAWGVGRAVAHRSTRPLIDFQERIRGLRGLEPLPPPEDADMPAEVADLEEAFRALWSRLEGTVLREREFAANASHELRLPLARIRLLAEQARTDASGAGRQALDAQVEEVDRLVRVVESLLVLARDASAGIPRGEAVNLADVARRVTARVLDGAAGDCAFPDEAECAATRTSSRSRCRTSSTTRASSRPGRSPCARSSPRMMAVCGWRSRRRARGSRPTSASGSSTASIARPKRAAGAMATGSASPSPAMSPACTAGTCGASPRKRKTRGSPSISRSGARPPARSERIPNTSRARPPTAVHGRSILEAT